MNFPDINLNESIQKSLVDLNFINPTPIQIKAIPFLLESNQDLISLAQTGTGKTAAFGLPIINNINTNVNNSSTLKALDNIQPAIKQLMDKFNNNLSDMSINVNINQIISDQASEESNNV